LVPVSNGPIYKGILPDSRSLLLVPNFPKKINPTQIVRPWQPFAYSFPNPVPRVRFKKSAQNRAIILRSAKVSQSESFVVAQLINNIYETGE